MKSDLSSEGTCSYLYFRKTSKKTWNGTLEGFNQDLDSCFLLRAGPGSMQARGDSYTINIGSYLKEKQGSSNMPSLPFPTHTHVCLAIPFCQNAVNNLPTNASTSIMVTLSLFLFTVWSLIALGFVTGPSTQIAGYVGE